MRRALAAALLAAAALAPTTAHASHYGSTCGGAVDYQCSGSICRMDCFPPEDCLIWLDPTHNPQSAFCIHPVGPL
jgi:hypothetical protein